MRPNEIVRAGAGAGKTTRLTGQVLEVARRFQEEHGRFPRMVVTTFTRKATQELRERLMLRALETDTDMIDFVNSRSHLVVATIHGVLDLYLKRYGGNICIDPSYRVMGGTEPDKIARQALRSVLFKEEKFQPLLEMYGFNRLADLVRRFHEMHLRDPEARPHSVATFDDVFREYAEELADDLGEVARSILAETEKDDWKQLAVEFKSLAAILRRGDWPGAYAEATRLIENFKAVRFTAKNPPVEEGTNERMKEVRERARKLCKDEAFDPGVWQDFASTFALLNDLGLEFSASFRQAKIRLGSLEISDLELLAMDCIRNHPETAAAFAQEWDYWLIDEYQDTSPFQVELLRHLCGPSPCFIVGDPQQSIYLFRGARSDVFRQKEEEILSGGGRQDFLKKNYRSKPELLLFFNDFFAGFEPPFAPMDPNITEQKTHDPGRRVATFFIAPGAGDSPSPGDGGDGAADAAEAAVTPGGLEAAGVAASVDPGRDPEIAGLVRHVQDLLKAGAAFEEICVLARKNGTLTEVARWLEAYGLPTHVHAASGFYDRREIQDALALLRFLVNPHDNHNLIQLLRSPWFRVEDAVLVRHTRDKQLSFWTRFSRLEKSVEWEAVERLKHHLEERKGKGVTETFRGALIRAGFVDLAHFHDRSGRRESNLWKLLSKLRDEECKPGFNYLNFINNAQAELRKSGGGEEGDAVAAVEPNRINLMTIHASKGLQFKHVILPRMGEAPRLTRAEDFTFDESRRLWAARMPMGESLDMTGSLAEKVWLRKFQEQELREHDRVLYVALTRAIETVFMSWTGIPKNDSWAARMRWNLAPGAHAAANYVYEVASRMPEPEAGRALADEAVVPRARWDHPDRADGAETKKASAVAPVPQKSSSVTRLLERAGQAGFTPASAAPIPQRLKISSEGTAFHRLVELQKYPSRERIEKLISRWFPEKSEKVVQAFDFVKSLEDPPLSALIDGGHVEWGFAVRLGDTMVEGQIDLWGRSGKVVWIVDYKTGNPELSEKAFQQLALYAVALEKSGEIEPGDKVRLAAVYPFAEKVFVRDAGRSAQTLADFGIG